MVTADRACLQPICATLQRFSHSMQHSDVNVYSLRGAGKFVVRRGKGKGAHLHSRKLVYIKLSRPQKTKPLKMCSYYSGNGRSHICAFQC